MLVLMLWGHVCIAAQPVAWKLFLPVVWVLQENIEYACEAPDS